MDEVSLVDVATCISEAWDQVERRIIIKAFKKAKILPYNPDQSDSSSESDSDIDSENSDMEETDTLFDHRTKQMESYSEFGAGNSNVKEAEQSTSSCTPQYADQFHSDNEEEFSGFSSDDLK